MRFFGSVGVMVYVDIPIGFVISFSVYSTVVLLFSLQIMSPIEGFSSSSFTLSLSADR